VFQLRQGKNGSCDSLNKDAYAAAWSRIPQQALITKRPAPAKWFSLFTGLDIFKKFKAFCGLLRSK